MTFGTIETDSLPRPSFALDLIWMLCWIGAPAATGFILGLLIAPLLRLLHRIVAVVAIVGLGLALAGVVQVHSVGEALTGWLSWFDSSSIPSAGPHSPEVLGAIGAFLIGKAVGLAVYRWAQAKKVPRD
ncbi:MAG: hypothetical protein KJZ69_12890 [Phycisphaerales bacterium]|nr:hypothetical protein [Phycisphaerales bacterium]